MTTAPAQAATTTRPDPIVGYLLRLVGLGAPIVAVLAVVGSHELDAMVGGVVALVVLARFPSPLAVRLTGTVLVLAPDAVVVAHLGAGTPLSLRECAFVWCALSCLVASVRGELKVTVPARFLTFVIVLIAVLGAMANGRQRSLVEFAVLIVVPLVAGASVGTDVAVASDFLRGLTVGTILLVGWALTEAVTNHNYLVQSTVLGSFVREGRIRANAGWDYPTMLAAFLCLGGFFVVHLFAERWRLPGMLVGGVLVTAAVIATQSRSGLIGLGAGAVTYVVLQGRLSQVLRVLVGLVLAGGAFLLIPGLAPASFRGFLSQSLDSGTSANANVAYRQNLYHAAGAAMSHQPVWGYGWGAGKSVATNELSTYFGTMTDLASLPVSLGVELGYAGAGAVGLFLLVVVFKLARHRDVPGRLPIAAGIVGCVVAMLGVPVSPPLSWLLLLAAVGWSLHRTWRADQIVEPEPAAPEPEETWTPSESHWSLANGTVGAWRR
jgi:hypothetical protein